MKLILSILALIYFLSPYDFLPDTLLGWGWIDDLAILYLLWKFYYKGQGGWFSGPSTAGKPSGDRTDRHGQGAAPPNQKDAPRDPYEVLQISRNASAAEIRAAYKTLAGKYHPDKVLHLGEEFQALAEERFKEIQAAYRELVPKEGPKRS